MRTTEVADSDDELELASAINQPASLSATTSATDPLNVNFDQFLSPTQRLSSLDSSTHDARSNHSSSSDHGLAGVLPTFDGSADSAEREVRAQQEVATMPNKRSHSMLEDASRNEIGSGDGAGAKKKRAKTYGQNRSRPQSSQDHDLFPNNAPLLEPDSGTSKAALGPASITTSAADTEILHVDASTVTHSVPSQDFLVHDADVRERNRPRRVVSLLGDSINEQPHTWSTSRSSMGTYESINLDFRGGQGKADVANPFATLKSSEDGTSNSSLQAEKIVDIFRQARQSHQPEQVPPVNAFEAECRTSPELSKEPETVHLQYEQGVPNDVGATELVSMSAADFNEVAMTTGEESQAPRKKRGLKPKPRPEKPQTSHVVDDNEDELHRDEVHNGQLDEDSPSRSRDGTVDSVSHESQTDNIPRKNKRKRKLSVQVENNESSPVKHPTSELNLSDEAVVGLPKENYKPRPSRSRSKKIIDEVDEIGLDTPQKQDESAPPEIPIEITPPAKSAKKARKAKVKRAKTSAAALLKKTEQMLSDGEEDVMWVDTKPAKVKLDLPPEVSPQKLKMEQSDAEEHNAHRSIQEESHNATRPGISVEIPTATTTIPTVAAEPPNEIPQSAPKKRGRKKKVLTDEPQTNLNPPPEPDAEPEPERTPLAEKSINTTLNETTSEPKPPVSPLTPPKALLPTQPNPSTTENNLTSPSSKPQPHSPLKTLSTTKTKYRLGLSKRHSIPSLLRRVDKDKKPPTVVMRKEKESKKKKDQDCDGEGEGEGGDGGAGKYGMRDGDGMLVEWDH